MEKQRAGRLGLASRPTRAPATPAAIRIETLSIGARTCEHGIARRAAMIEHAQQFFKYHIRRACGVNAVIIARTVKAHQLIHIVAIDAQALADDSWLVVFALQKRRSVFAAELRVVERLPTFRAIASAAESGNHVSGRDNKVENARHCEIEAIQIPGLRDSARVTVENATVRAI